MFSFYDYLISPIDTEKSYFLRDNLNIYVFLVRLNVKKLDLLYAFKKSFGVKVLKCNTLIVKPKRKVDRKGMVSSGSFYKKAFFYLEKDEKINLY